jgi:hypothetical protein
MVYQVIDGVVTELKRATVDGSIQVEITSDPELVVAATAPTAPRTVSALSGSRNSSVVSWSAPSSNGGSAITSYDVLVNGNVVCLATTALSCDLTNLADATTYNVSVIARNAIGESSSSNTSFTTASAPSVEASSSQNQLSESKVTEEVSSPDSLFPSTELESGEKQPETGPNSDREDHLTPGQSNIFARPEFLNALSGLLAGLAIWVFFVRRRKRKNRSFGSA